MSVEECKLIDLPKILDYRGNLTFIESMKHIPFEIKRVYYLYDVPGGESRGGHANINTEYFIIAISGSFDVLVDDGRSKKTFYLNRADFGLYIPKMMWRSIEHFSSGSVCLVLVNTFYSDDYMRDYDEFKRKAVGLV